MTWHIIGILVFVVIYNIWRYYHEDDSDDYGPNIEPEPKNNEVNGSWGVSLNTMRLDAFSLSIRA